MRSLTSGTNAAALIQFAGRLWGRCVIRHGVCYLDRRCAAFPLTLSGVHHLREACVQPCLVVANHVIIRAEDAPLGTLTQARALTLLNQPPDSFIFRRVVREQTGLSLHVVAKSDRGWWSPRPLVRLLQKRVGQPFGKGLLEGIGFIPVERNPECFHRTFFHSAAETIRRGRPILIFPGKLVCDESGCRDSLVDANISDGGLQPGAAHLARKFGLPILPAYIDGAEGWRPSRPAGVRFGPSFHPQGMTKADINRAIIERVRALAFPEQVIADSRD